jgi:imidazolonepropionase-like amidohydrolase
MEVSGGEIRSIRSGCTAGERAGADVDLSSCTVLPVLCDCHVHLSMSGTEDGAVRKKQLSASFAEAKETIGRNLASHLAHGIAAVRDGGDRQAHALQYKRTELPCGAPVQVLSAGRAWHARGRYGAMIGRTPAQGESLASAILRSGGTDLVKILNSGPNSLSRFGRETPPQFSLEDLRQAASSGRSLGLKLMVHANGRVPVQGALEAGCDSIEHGYLMGMDNLRRMADRGIPWTPTAHAMQALSRAMRGTPEGDAAARYLDLQLDLIRLSREYGAVVALGTDAGSLGVNHGEALLEELRLFITAGMSPEEAVQCGSSTAFRLLGLDRLGSLEAGREASFVAAGGGPERLPESLRTPEAVFIEGVRIARGSFIV